MLEARASVWDAIWSALWPRWSGDCGDAVAVDDRRCHPCAVEAMVRASRETRMALWGRATLDRELEAHRKLVDGAISLEEYKAAKTGEVVRTPPPGRGREVLL